MNNTGKTILAALLSIFLIAIACSYCANKLLPLQEKIAPDMLIFLEHGEKFRLTGELYNRESENMDLNFLYRPSGSEYKFPPAAEVFLYPFFRNGIAYLYRNILPNLSILDSNAFTPFRVFAFCMLQISIFITVFWCSHYTWQTLTTTRKILLVGIFYSTTLISEPLFSNIYYLNFEIFLFFIISIACLCIIRSQKVAGLLIGIATGIKIYPVFFALYFIGVRNFRGLIWLLTGCILMAGAGFLIFGGKETYFYLIKIFPLISREEILDADYNLGIGKWLNTGATASIANPIFDVLRLFIAGSSFYIFLKKCRQPEQQPVLIAISLIVMVLLLRNYWTAYQVFLFPAYFLLCTYTLARPSVFRIIALLFCGITLFMDQNWWGETQLLREVGDTDPELIRQYWDAQDVSEYAIKSFIFPIPQSASIIYFLTQCKVVTPFLLWAILAKEALTATSEKTAPEGH